MSGQGKYTNFAPPASSKNTLLNKLFHSADAVQKPPTQDLVGQENDARTAVLAIAIAKLQPSHQDGDLGYFPSGVDLDYSGASASIQAADTAEGQDVKWTNAGDPANSYVPDISSPGPGKTDGTDKATDPNVKVVDLKPNYVAGGPGTGTKSPTSTAAKIIAANLLGVPGKLGDSGANT
jgi:hypothetical protein